MTASTSQNRDWANRPVGKVARAGIAVAGMVFATLILMYSAIIDNGSWALVLVGVALAATAVRVASQPTLSRIGILGATVLAVPLSLMLF